VVNLFPLLSKAIEKVSLQKCVQQLENQVGKKVLFCCIIGNLNAINIAIGLAKKVAQSTDNIIIR